VTRQEQIAFIEKLAPAAQQSAARFGVPASVTLAQSILESRWGESGLAQPPPRGGNNFFGIKARQGEDYCEFSTFEDPDGAGPRPMVKVRARFRKYPSIAQSFAAHAQLLSKLKRYGPAMAVASDPLAFAIKLRECGYATDPNYPKKLAALIQQYGLERFDRKEKP